MKEEKKKRNLILCTCSTYRKNNVSKRQPKNIIYHGHKFFNPVAVKYLIVVHFNLEIQHLLQTWDRWSKKIHQQRKTKCESSWYKIKLHLTGKPLIFNTLPTLRCPQKMTVLMGEHGKNHQQQCRVDNKLLQYQPKPVTWNNWINNITLCPKE